jgi:AraC-like DNA-binding protein
MLVLISAPAPAGCPTCNQRRRQVKKPNPRRCAAPPRRREKVFGPGDRCALDRNVRARIGEWIRALERRTEKGKAYGAITGKAGDVARALLWCFLNAKTGQCDPSYEAIANAAGCARSTVADAIKMLETTGLLTWQHRIARERVRERDLFGRWRTRWRVLRRSNAYQFVDPKAQERLGRPSKSGIQTGTTMLFNSVSSVDVQDGSVDDSIRIEPALSPGLRLAFDGLKQAMTRGGSVVS